MKELSPLPTSFPTSTHVQNFFQTSAKFSWSLIQEQAYKWENLFLSSSSLAFMWVSSMNGSNVSICLADKYEGWQHSKILYNGKLGHQGPAWPAIKQEREKKWDDWWKWKNISSLLCRSSPNSFQTSFGQKSPSFADRVCDKITRSLMCCSPLSTTLKTMVPVYSRYH